MKLIKIIFLIAPVFFLGSTCTKESQVCHKTITFINDSGKTLYVTSAYEYPDTLYFRYSPNPILDSSFSKVQPKENNNKVLSSSDCIELAFKDLIPKDTLMVYLFDAEVLETTPWDTVVSNNLVLKRYDLSLQNLENMNWTITYP